MLHSTARIPTDRAERYRDQLARHGAGMLRQAGHGHGAGKPPIRKMATSGGPVLLRLAWGECTVTAAADALVLVAEAATPADLARIQTGVGQRVAKIGRRDGLVVAWSPADEVPAARTPDA